METLEIRTMTHRLSEHLIEKTTENGQGMSIAHAEQILCTDNSLIPSSFSFYATLATKVVTARSSN